jgi:DNA helicase-2/ATP-dependent DNA helicase PcrA
MVSENEEGVAPTIIEYQDDYQEADRVLSKIQDPENTAVLARTNRQLFVFQKLCTARNLKYKYLGKDGFWQQPEVRRLLKLAKDANSGDKPASEVLADQIREHNLVWIYRNLADLDNDPVKNLNDAVRMSAGKGNVTEFLNYLRRLTYATKAVKCLTLSTIHQAKGREFDNVYLIGCNQGKMPHRDGEIGEERRIFFVACSRSARHLEISFSGTRSEFLNNYIERIQVYDEESIAEV